MFSLILQQYAQLLAERPSVGYAVSLPTTLLGIMTLLEDISIVLGLLTTVLGMILTILTIFVQWPNVKKRWREIFPK